MPRRFTTLAALSLGLAIVSAPGCLSETPEAPPPSSAAPPPTAPPSLPPPVAQQAPRAAQTTIASDLPPLPSGILWAVRPPEVMRATYEFAASRPDVMRYVPCFCGCERGGHKDNGDCFVASRDASGRVTAWDSHAIGCEVCVDVAHQAMQMTNSGASVTAIRAAVEQKYASHGGGHTPTPAPPGKAKY